jgi:hypothetical protein
MGIQIVGQVNNMRARQKFSENQNGAQKLRHGYLVRPHMFCVP